MKSYVILIVFVSFIFYSANSQSQSDTVFAGITSQGMVFRDIVQTFDESTEFDINEDGIIDLEFDIHSHIGMMAQYAYVEINMLGNL